MRRIVEYAICLSVCAVVGYGTASWLDRGVNRSALAQITVNRMHGPSADESGARAAWANAEAWAASHRATDYIAKQTAYAASLVGPAMERQQRALYMAHPGVTLEQLRRDVDAGRVTGITALDIAVVAAREKR